MVIHVVDDEPEVRTGMVRLLNALEFDARAYGSASAFVEANDLREPGCAILDYEMPEIDGLSLHETLVAAAPWQVIFYTGRADIPTSVLAMKLGATDFLVKPATVQQIAAALSLARARLDAVLATRESAREILHRVQTLSPREREVLGHVIAGRLNKQIAGHLGTAEKTVKIQRRRVMQKMGVRSVAELVRLTERVGLQPAPHSVHPDQGLSLRRE